MKLTLYLLFFATFIAVSVSTAYKPSNVLPLEEEPLGQNYDYCSTGPPGRYCLKDLSGYYDCRIDPKTGTYIDTVYSCQKDTRCRCYYGPKCAQKMANPCVHYVIPPKFPQSYLMSYTGEKQTCSPIGCISSTFSGIRYQDTKNKGRFREDSIVANGMDVTVLIFAQVAQYDINWGARRCTKSKPLPLGPFQIPEYYSFDGKEIVNGVEADRWHWFVGAHNAGEGYESSYFYATHTLNEDYVPVKIFRASNYGPPIKESSWSNETTGEFKSQQLNDTIFRIPSFCKMF